MSQKSYSEKLRDPRWQKKRLEIMQRDEFACCRCFSKTETLNIHHKNYIKGKEPWEYDDSLLITYCEGCHHDLEFQRDQIEVLLCDEMFFMMFVKLRIICELSQKSKKPPSALYDVLNLFMEDAVLKYEHDPAP